jgi:tRNA A-37 threonylcarbamoyl transferase component Bud32
MSREPQSPPGREGSDTQSFSTAPAATQPLPQGAGTPQVPASLIDHTRYRILELLGAGGMGAVYKAEHQLMQRTVALKVINPSLVDRPIMVERFRREVRAAARLAHPNIVTAYDAEQAGGFHFLVMEFVEGTSLARLVAAKGPLPVAQACDYARQAALGLQHAHEKGMVHRDIKPQNLMLTPHGQVKVLDFGLARFALESAPAGAPLAPAAAPGESPDTPSASTAHDCLTQTGAVVGTPDYLAPEQARDAHQADIRADIYSLGCTLYHLLTGRTPFPGGAAQDKLIAHCERAPAPLTDLRGDVPPALARAVERMMAKEAARRPQTPADVAEALAPFLPKAPPSRRGTRRAPAVAAAACALALLAGAVVYVVIGHFMAQGQDSREGVPVELVAGPEKAGKPRRPARGEGVPAKYRESVGKGLAYLAQAQGNDGHWEALGGQYPTAMTALAGMALLTEGSTLADGPYADPLRRAVSWMMEHSQPTGLLDDPNLPGAGHYLFGHGYAMLFLATVYGQEEDGDRRRRLEAILTRAVEFTGRAQTRRGGWGYVAAAEGGEYDESASTIVQLQALRAARNAGIAVPKKLIDIDYLRRATTPGGSFMYSLAQPDQGERPALTAAALACMLTAGEYDSDLARRWIALCRQTVPIGQPARRIGHDEFTHYYYAQALYILGDGGYAKLFPGAKPEEQLTWSKYRETMFEALRALQADDGGWNIGPIGPVYATACYLTILQLDNGALGIYQR